MINMAVTSVRAYFGSSNSVPGNSERYENNNNPMTTQSHSQDSRFSYILVLILAVLVTFLNAAAADFIIVDDIDTIKHIQSSGINFMDILTSHGDRYYRPLAIVSLLLDSTLFGKNPTGFHIVNLLFHLCNSLLVYYLALELVGDHVKKDYYALIASLTFALHPITTEAVVWISARPDLLSCFFFLLSLTLIVKHRASATPFRMFLLFSTFLCALLSKESSIGLMILWVLYCISEKNEFPLKSGIMISFTLGSAVLFYFFLRAGISFSENRGMLHVISSTNSSSSLVLDTLSTYGFYLRKMIFPFPLNFVIVSIDKVKYVLVSLLLLVPASVLYIRHKSFRLPLLVLFTGIIPPVLALIGKLPYTPYAERYLYLPLTGFSLFVIFILARYLDKIPPIVAVSTVLLLAIPTVHRVIEWTYPIKFWENTIVQSPLSPVPHLALAAELIGGEDYPAAEKQIKIAFEIGMKREIERQFAMDMLRIMEQARISAHGKDMPSRAVPSR